MDPEHREVALQNYAVGKIAKSQYATGEANMLRLILRELAYRKIRGLDLYQPMPHQLPFHKSQAPERIVFGSNRSGKTTTAAVDVAMAVTGRHPYIDYPKENGICYCVAKDGIKIGQVMIKKLLRRGAYRIVYDQQLGMYRRWIPEIDVNIPRRDTKASLPLIPKEDIEKIAWDKKAQDWPKLIKLKNGWEIVFFTSAGKPMEGPDIDICWFDEEIYDNGWYSEMSARLIDRAGRFLWSFTPDLATDQAHSLYEEAEKCRGTPNPRIEAFFLHMDKNDYLTDEQRNIFKAKLANNPDKYKVKVEGQFLVSSQRVYPNFNTVDHGCDHFEIPHTWTRYLILDPGFANCFATMIAVPPPNAEMWGRKIGHHKFVYDEYYTQGVDCNEFSRVLEMKCRGQQFEAFLIDDHGSRKNEQQGQTIARQFEKAFKAHNLKSLSTGFGFVPMGEDGNASNSPLIAQVQDVREWLWKEYDNKPVLQIIAAYCPNMMEQMKMYKHKLDPKTKKPTDKPDSTKYSHGPDTIRYAKMHGLPYVEPTPPPKPINPVVKYFQAKVRARLKARKGGAVHM